ncbi:MAG: restriction endonuclease subunit S [Candidatus Aenigmarchaeota archaeon]|nr:restriction endonuclease subunit S [Candidatus Aenigmarchaeota archaeon]
MIFNNKLNNSNQIPNKTLKEVVVAVKRGLSSYYLHEDGNKTYFINIKDVHDGKINHTTVETVCVKKTNAIEKSRIKPKDVLVTIKGSTFRAAVADESVNDFVISANLIAFKLSDEVLPEIVAAYINSSKCQKEIRAISAGAVQKALNLKSLMGIKIPIPDKKNQLFLEKYILLSKEHNEFVKRENELQKKINDKIIEKYMG